MWMAETPAHSERRIFQSLENPPFSFPRLGKFPTPFSLGKKESG
jgi:hypothetical protein